MIGALKSSICLAGKVLWIQILLDSHLLLLFSDDDYGQHCLPAHRYVTQLRCCYYHSDREFCVRHVELFLCILCEAAVEYLVMISTSV